MSGTALVDLSASRISKPGLITAGDFDGDGVEDIAVGNATSVAVFRGIPGTKRGRRPGLSAGLPRCRAWSDAANASGFV